MGLKRRVCLVIIFCISSTALLLLQLNSSGPSDGLTAPGSPPTTSRPPAKKTIKKLPSCIVIGVRKGGTRALIDMLGLNPRVKSAKTEVHFFDHPENYRRGYAWYRDQMPALRSGGGEIAIEKSPSYFVTEGVPTRVYNMSRRVLLILVVRDPVTRLISDYAQILENHREKSLDYRPFEEVVFLRNGSLNWRYDAIRKSMYASHMRRWLQFFPLSQILIVHGEKFVHKPWHELNKVERFLGLRKEISEEQFYFNATKGFHCFQTRSKKEQCLAKNKGRKHPDVPEKVVSRLRRYFAPFNYDFYNLVHRDFGWPEQ